MIWPFRPKPLVGSFRDKMISLAQDEAWGQALGMLAISKEPIDALLLVAIWQNREDMVDVLLAQGANPNARCGKGTPAIIHAVDRCASEMVQLLLGAGANPNAAGPKGTVAAALAHSKKKEETLGMLCRAGATWRAPIKQTREAATGRRWAV